MGHWLHPGTCRTPTDYRSLVGALQAEDPTVEPIGAVSIAAEGRVITIDGTQVQIYEFTNTAAAEPGSPTWHLGNFVVEYE